MWVSTFGIVIFKIEKKLFLKTIKLFSFYLLPTLILQFYKNLLCEEEKKKLNSVIYTIIFYFLFGILQKINLKYIKYTNTYCEQIKF